MMFNFLNEIKNKPQLQLVIEPTNKVRFRYASEKGSHGPIVGITSTKRKKTFPTVKLINYNGTKDIIIRVSLYTKDKEKHVLELKGEKSWNGMIYEAMDSDLQAKFSSLVILNKKKEEVYRILMDRKLDSLHYTGARSARRQFESEFDTEIKKEAKEILNSVRLCFEAFFKDNMHEPICPKIFSEPVYNSKATVCSDLRIHRISRSSGTWKGGDEVILLCDKVQKDNINVVFYETDADGDTIWTDKAIFTPADVHYQYAITFKTPPYYANVEKVVFISLLRNDDDSSDPVHFTYIADEESLKKRKRTCAEPLEDIRIIQKEIFQEINYASPSTSNSEVSMDTEERIAKDTENENCSNLDLQENFASILPNQEEVDELLREEGLQFFLQSIEFDGVPYSDLPLPFDVVLEHSNVVSSDIHTDSQKDIEKNQPINDVQTDSWKMVEKVQNQSMSFIDIDSLTLYDKFQNDEDKSSDEERATTGENKYSDLMLTNRKQKNYSHLLSKKDEKGNNLLHLAINLDKESIKTILKMNKITHSDLVNEQNKSRKTPLHLAVEQNDELLIRLFLFCGGNPSMKDANGNSCFHIAARNASCLKLLSLFNFKSSFNVDTFNYEGLTPVHIAVKNDLKDCLLLLKDLGADLNIKEHKGGRSPLHFAVENSFPCTKILLDQECIDVNIQDFEGNTPLHLACANGFTKMVKLLLDADADPLSENFHMSSHKEHSESCGERPEDLAHDDTEILELLRKRISAKDKKEASDSDYSECSTDSLQVFNIGIEEKLCELLGPPSSGWKDLGMYAGVDELLINSIETNHLNPAKALLTYLQKQYKTDFMNIIKNALEMAELTEALKVIEE